MMILASLSFASLSAYTSWSSPTIPRLTQHEEYAGIKLTPNESSWLVSSFFLGVTIGGLPAAYLLDIFGRKKTLLLSGLLMVLPWIPLSFPNSLTMILARFVGGLGASFATTIIPIYVGEIADKDIRGQLNVIQCFIGGLGSVLILSIGPFVPYKVLNLVCASLPFSFVCTFLTAPESPYYLVKLGKPECARRSIIRLLNSNTNSAHIENQLKEIKEIVENDMKNRATFKEVLLNADYRKSMWIIIGLRSFHQLSGLIAIDSYLQTIMESANIGLSPELIGIIGSALQLPVVLLSAILVDRLGRKPLLAISLAGAFITLAFQGTFFYLKAMTEIDLTTINYLPVICALLYILFISIGIHPLQSVIFGELLATNVKKIGGILFTFYGSGLGFITVKLFGPVAETVGIYALFWFFSGCCLLGVFFSIYLIPETKNKSFAEVQSKLSRRGVK